MKKENNKNLFIAVFLLTAFAIWTAALRLVDVKPIGPHGSFVGFAALNSFIHELTCVHFTLYNITDWAGLFDYGDSLCLEVPFIVMMEENRYNFERIVVIKG